MRLSSKLFMIMIAVVFLASCKKEAATGTFTVTVENAFTAKNYLASGAIEGLVMPGDEQTFSFHAGKGTYLSLATMFVQSNDLFYAFEDTGIALYDNDGNPVTGDVTGSISLWDAGTEVNEEPGVGMNQAPRQSGPNTGMMENGMIQKVNDAFTYPMANTVIKVMLAHDGGTMFTATLQNVSGSATLATPFAGTVWGVHGAEVKLFEDGTTATAGLEAIAEDGNNEMMGTKLADNTGYYSPYAPGVWAVHEDIKVFFENGVADRGEGLEALAEDGDPAALATTTEGTTGVISSGVFNTPDGASAAGPLLPENTYSFTFDAKDGDYLSLATMLVHTNDLFYAFGEGGIALFDDGVPVTGDVTSSLSLWDAGTEVNEYPGAGNNQPVRGGGNSGAVENGVVQKVSDAFTYPATADAIKVTISAQ